MLGLQTNLKEQQKYIQNSQNQLEVGQNSLVNPLEEEQFNKIAQAHALSNDIFLLQTEIHKKQQYLREICSKIKAYYDFRARQRQLQAKEQALENDLEELQIYQDKIKKELRLISQEEQIMKGKMIVQHNKITETKQEYNGQTKRKQLLNKHLEEIKKGSENLRRKVKVLKEDLKRASSGKAKIEQNSISAELNKLASVVQSKQKKLKNILEQKEKHISSHEYSQLVSKLEVLRQQCEDEEQLQETYEQLMKQKAQLEERISFLKNVDSQFINQKKSLIQKLRQKYTILENQKQAQSAELARYEEQLALIQNEQKQGVGMIKKMSKRKREGKSKQNKQQINEVQMHPKFERQVELEQKTVNRWKGKTLRKHCMVLMTVIGIVGLLVGSVASLYS